MSDAGARRRSLQPPSILCACAGASRRIVAAEDSLIGEQHVRLTAEGAIQGAAGLRRLIARSDGISPAARARLWPHLLGLDAWEATLPQLQRSRADRADRFEQLVQRTTSVDKRDWTVIAGDVPRTDRDLARWRDEASLAPLHSLLLTHCVYRAAKETTAGHYCQGMNDVAAVVLDAVPHAPTVYDAMLLEAPPPPPPQSPTPTPQQLATAFWLFEAVLDEMPSNFAGEGFPGMPIRGSNPGLAGHRSIIRGSRVREVRPGTGVWEQTRAVSGVIAAASPRLARHLKQIDASRSPELAEAQPLACLFQAVLLRLKREMCGGAGLGPRTRR